MKGHAGGSLPASQEADFFFDRDVQERPEHSCILGE